MAPADHQSGDKSTEVELLPFGTTEFLPESATGTLERGCPSERQTLCPSGEGGLTLPLGGRVPYYRVRSVAPVASKSAKESALAMSSS